ncbi:hypothetical protein GCM10027049_10560 [Mucilaginibacter puniceus]
MMMNLFKNNRSKEASDKVNDQLAAVLANRLIKVQFRIAQYLNAWFNAYSVKQRKWILLSSGVLIAGLLIAGVFSSFYSISLWSQGNYTSAHIGMASEIPKPNFSKHQLIDSLTIKK